MRSKRTKTEYNKGKGMPETGCSLLLSLRAVEYRLFGVVQDAFCFEGCSSDRRIIPEREFLSAGMKSAEKNHLWERIFIRRDEISGEESSLREDFVR